VVKTYELPASTPVVVTVAFSDGSEVTARADSSGRIAFPPKRTESVRLTFGESRLLVNVDSATGAHSFAPIGFSELVVRGAEALRVPLDPYLSTGVPCGFGPSLTVNGRTLQTSVEGRISDLLEGRSLSWSVCPSDPVGIEAGKTILEAAVSGEFAPQRLDLLSEAVASQPDAVQVDVTRPTPAALSVAAGIRQRSEMLVVPQNFSTGWVARDSAGRQLEARRVNGWQQGWILPAGAATVVTAEFVPDRTYRWGLLAGAILLLTVGAVSLTTVRRPERRGERVRTGSRAGVVVASAGLSAVLGGVPGLVGLLLATGLHLWMRQVRGGWWRVPVVLVAFLSAAAAVALRPWPEYQLGTASWPVQTLVWLALCLGVLAVWPGRLWLRRSRTRRISGLSSRT
jgi:arabinofuranan 3-O-arabinosyltransferase